MILAAGILAALGSLCVVLGSLIQAWLAYYQLNPLKPKPDMPFAEGLGYGIADVIITSYGLFFGWLLVLAGGVLTFAGAMVAIIAALS
jgi:hypothetical protein